MALAGFHNCMYGTGLGGMGSGNVLVDCLMYINLAWPGAGGVWIALSCNTRVASHRKRLALGNGPHFQYPESYF